MDEIKIGSIVLCKIVDHFNLTVGAIFIGRIEYIPSKEGGGYSVSVIKIIKDTIQLSSGSLNILIFEDEFKLVAEPSDLLKGML